MRSACWFALRARGSISIRATRSWSATCSTGPRSRRRLNGARYLVHAAADYRLWAPSPDDLLRANVEGTRIVMEEALRAGVERIVYTSSVATFDLRAGGLADETRHLPETEAIGAYKRSKIIAEDLVADMVARDRLPAVIVNPSTPIGPRDVKPTPTGRIIIEAASGRMPAFVETGLNFVHVDDVAAGHLAALQRGRIGERYILGGENVSLRQVLLDIAGIVGRRARPLRLPRGAVYPFAFGAEMLARATGRAPFATVDGLRMARYTMHFDDSKARRELGYTSRPYRDGLVEAIEWFIQAGYMKRPRQYDPALERGRPPLAQELEELDALAQPALHHLRRAHHLVDDRGDLRRAEVERFVELLDRVENLAVAQVRIVQRRDLDAVVVDQIGVVGVEPAVLLGLLVQERAGIRRRERNLDGVRVDLLGEADGFLNGFLGFARQAEDEGAVDLDAQLVAVLGELPRDVDQHALLDVVQDLLVAGLVADDEQPAAVVGQHFEGLARHIALGVAGPDDAELADLPGELLRRAAGRRSACRRRRRPP